MHIFTRFLLAQCFWAAFAVCMPHKVRNDTWHSLAPIPVAPRQEHTTVAISSNTLAILGGILPNASTYSTTALMQFYSIPDNVWTSAAALPTPLNHANAAVVDGKIYVLGGLIDPGNGTWSGTPDCWSYDPHTNIWTTLDPMPTEQARGSAAVVVYGSTIYLAGGVTTIPLVAGAVLGTVDFVSAFNTSSGRWISVPEAASHLPEGRDHAGRAIVDSTFYVLGGRYRSQDNVKDTVFELDLRNMELGWKTSKARMPTPRGGLASGTIGSKVYTFGGEGNPANGSQGVFPQTEAYDAQSDSWERLQDMKVPRHGTYAVGVGGRVYIPGGGLVEGVEAVDTFDAYEP